MKIFVAGATGYTGREVVRELRDRGVEVAAHIRPDSPRLREWQERFQRLGATVDATPWEHHSFESTLARHQPSHVFALLGTTRARAHAAAKHGADESYESVDYRLTSIVLHATRNAKFVYLSSFGVNASTHNPYLTVRRRLESEIKASGLPYIIARPALVTGSDREEFRFGERAAATLTNAALDVAGAIGLRSLRERFASMTGQELARALVNAALDASRVNVVLEAAELRALAIR